MKITDFPTDDPAFLLELLIEAQLVMSNLVGTITVIAQASTQDTLDGEALCRGAAAAVAAGQREQADVERRTNEVAMAKIIDQARERFEGMIDQALAGAPARH